MAPSLWNAVAVRITEQRPAVNSGTRFSLREWINGLLAAPALGASLAGAIAIVVMAAVIGIVYLKTHGQQPQHEVVAVVTLDKNEGQKGGREDGAESTAGSGAERTTPGP